MTEFLNTPIFLLTFTLGIYLVGLWLYRKSKVALLHPLLLSIGSIIVFLKAVSIPYDTYIESTQVIDLMLGLSVVSLGYLLHEQLSRIKGNVISMLTAIFVGSAVGIVSVAWIARWLGAGDVIVASLQPKSVTAPIAIAIAENSGGLPALTSVVVISVGIFGSLCGPFVLKRLGIEDRIARGLALGAASHGIGTARAMELGAIEGAVSGLAIGLMGVATALLVPILERWL